MDGGVHLSPTFFTKIEVLAIRSQSEKAFSSDTGCEEAARLL